MEFEWDEIKASDNFRKHGVTFDEAVSVFEDAYFVDFYDSAHADSEHRFILAGMSKTKRLLLVSYTERGKVTRIISAREMTRAERKIYEQHQFE
jgi:uncharacterized DUF497 family protein